MKEIVVITLLFLGGVCAAQNTIASYPQDQDPYRGGNVQLFKDINSQLIQNNEKLCVTNEMYWATLKIDENGKPYLIRNKADGPNAERNKCAYDMLVRALGSLKAWQPAEVDGQKVISFFDFAFVPGDYFDNFTEGYDITKHTVRASFPGGIENFRKQMMKNISAYLDYDSYRPKGRFVLLFTVDKEGKMTHIDIKPELKNSERFFEDVRSAVKRIKGRWEPATIHSVPLESKFKFPLNFVGGHWE